MAATPATRGRSPWWAWVAVLTATALGATGFAIIDQAPAADDGPRVAGLLPPDGAAWQVVDEQYGTFVVEATRFTGFAELIDLPDLVSGGIAAAFESLGENVSAAPFFREVWTPLDAPAVDDHGTDVVEASQLTSIAWLADDGIRLTSVSGGEIGYVYSPPLLMVPEGVEPGSHWASEGDALPGGLLHYRSTGTAAAGDHGCLEITTETIVTDPALDGAAFSTSSEVAVWCRDAGVVAGASLVDGVESTSTTRPVSGGDEAVATAATAPELLPTNRWTAQALPIALLDPLFGDSALFLTVSPTGATTASGVTAIVSGRDLLGLEIDDHRAMRRFIAHPGGEIVRVSAVGNLLLVATSDRRLVAYDDRGVRRWTAEFDDIVLVDVIGEPGASLLAVALDGEVRSLDARDGSTRWSTSIGVDVSTAPLAAAGAIIVAGRDGSVVAIEPAGDQAGTIRWTASAESPVDLAVLADEVGDRVLVLTVDGTVVGLDAISGARAWIRTVEGSNSIVVLDAPDGEPTAVVHTSLGIEAFDRDGNRLWRLDDPLDDRVDTISAIGDSVALLRGDRIDIVDDHGAEIVAVPLPSAFATSRSQLLPRADGLLVLAGTGELIMVGPG